jgi:replicative DNA helicase
LSEFPTNPAAERSVLGALIESPDLLSALLSEGITERDFSVEDYRRIWRVLLELDAKQLPIDSISVVEKLSGSQNDYCLVAELISGAVAHPSHVLHHARIVRQKSRLRSLVTFSDWVMREAGGIGADPDLILKAAIETVAAL